MEALTFRGVSPHLLDALLRTSRTHRVHLADDLRDSRGGVLWAAAEPLSPSVAKRLTGITKLAMPLEPLLRLGTPATAISAMLLTRLRAESASAPALATVLAPATQAIDTAFKALPMTPSCAVFVAAMASAARPLLDHSIGVAAVAVALAHASGASAARLADIAQAGLLHDLGELYIDPQRLGRGKPLTVVDWGRIRWHPTQGEILAREFLGCNEAVCRAIAQSHERLDGTGYPAQLEGLQLADSSRALLVAEAVTTLMTQQSKRLGRGQGLRRAAMAIHLIPGEFPRDHSDHLYRLSRSGPGLMCEAADADADADALHLLRRVQTAVSGAWRVLGAQSSSDPMVTQLLDHARRALASCGWALRSTGMIDVVTSGPQRIDAEPLVAFEMTVVAQELVYRIKVLSRDLKVQAASDPSVIADETVQALGTVLDQV